MKTIAIAAVTAGGKTTIVNELKKQIANTKVLHFDDYPFAYCHEALREYIDCAIFIDTPLDIAMARRVLRDMKNATGGEIRQDMDTYLRYARVAYIQMLKDVLPSSDYVIDGAKELDEKVDEIKKIILSL